MLVALLLLTTATTLLAVASPSSAASASFCIDRTVASSDTGAGTSATPYCTISKGVAALRAGDTLFIGNGSYAETVKPLVSGTKHSPVTLTRWPGRSPVIGAGSTYGAYVVGRAHVVVSGLTFTGTVIDGIYVTGGDQVTVSGNTVTAAGQPRQGATAPGISLRSSSNSTVSGNTSDHNSSHGIYVSGTGSGNTIESNEASFNAEGWQRNAIGIDVLAPGNTVLRNVVHDDEDSGLQFYTGGDNNLATLNVSYDNGDHGIDDFNATTTSPPACVNSIANNYSTSTKTSGYLTVWRTAGVAAGDFVVLTLQLSGTTPTGTVTATDTAGNTYTQSASVADASGNRLVLVSGVATRSLVVNGRITATFPSATSYRMAGDEFAGATRLDKPATATGTTTTFSSGTALATVGNEIAFGAVSVPSGTTAPSWATGWRDLGAGVVGSSYLGRAYQLPASGGYTAASTASGPWLAAVSTFGR